MKNRWTKDEQAELRKIESRLEAKGIPSHHAAHLAEAELERRIECKRQRQKEGRVRRDSHKQNHERSRKA